LFVSLSSQEIISSRYFSHLPPTFHRHQTKPSDPGGVCCYTLVAWLTTGRHCERKAQDTPKISMSSHAALFLWVVPARVRVEACIHKSLRVLPHHVSQKVTFCSAGDLYLQGKLYLSLKELSHSLHILKSLASIFQIRRL